MSSQLVCSGCRNLLLYPRWATNVCCAICNTITSAPPGAEMAQLVCGGCRTLLMYTRGASSVRCSCCNTINLARSDASVYNSATNPVAHVNCGHCHTTLMYPYGAPSVKCSVCQYVSNIGMPNARLPAATPGTNGSIPSHPSTSAPLQPHHNQTVVVENPMSVDEHGKLVSNVVVGVSTEKK